MQTKHISFDEFCRMLICVLIASLLWAAVPLDATVASDTSEPNQQDIYRQLKEGRRLMPDQAGETYAKPRERTVYLTFDDGPSKLTPQILDVLKREGLPATFFVLGQKVREHPHIMRRIMEEGHQVGNHSFNHDYKELYADFRNYWNQLKQTEDAIADAVGKRPRIIRAPGGTYTNFDPFYFYYLQQAGYTVFDWNVDGGDARRAGVPAEEIVANISSGRFPHEAVVLLHDGAGHEETVKALPDIIKMFRDKGYVFAALDEQVRPVVFQKSKLKWNRRSVSYGDHVSIIEMIEEEGANAAWQRDAALHSPRTPSLSVVQSVYDADRATVPNLNVLLPSGRLELSPAEYELRGGRLIVPLRSLAEQSGARVLWDDRKRTAAVRHGGTTIVYDLPGKSMTVYRLFQKPQTYHLPRMHLRQDRLMVPLRDTATLLDLKVDGLTVTPALRAVALSAAGMHKSIILPPPDFGSAVRSGWSRGFGTDLAELTAGITDSWRSNLIENGKY